MKKFKTTFFFNQIRITQILSGLFAVGLISCNSGGADDTYPDVRISGAMKNIMWKGELAGIIKLDTLKDKKGLYGLGPLSYLKGELLINDGKSYVSRVTSDSTMSVVKSFDVTAPFFVYARVNEWQEMELPENIKTLKNLENFVDEKSKELNQPFAFMLSGDIKNAVIHIQNLPDGSKVSSPEEAHAGQTTYILKDEEVDIIGFFSTRHQGIFSHHDSFVHLHLITKDESKMGHLDEAEIGRMRLYLPKN